MRASRWRAHLLSNGVNYCNELWPDQFRATARMLELKSSLAIDHPEVQKALGAADFILFQRNVIHEEVWRSMDYWRALGKIILADLDDHYPMIPPANPAHEVWIQNSLGWDTEPIEMLAEGLRHADALISPNELILKDWSDEVAGYIWRNYPSFLDYENILRRQHAETDWHFEYDTVEDEEGNEKPELQILKRELPHPNPIIIGWGGSISHVDSFVYSDVVDGLARLMEENERVFFKFAGFEDRLEWLFEKLPEDRIIKQEGVQPQDWPQVVATFDVGIAPMDLRPIGSGTTVDTGEYSYDERRSALKIVEYMCAGVPFVATDCFPYRQFLDEIKYRPAGKLIPNGADSWYENLKLMVDSNVEWRKRAKKDRTWALGRLTIEANAGKLIKTYTQIGEEAQAKRGLRLPNAHYIEDQELKEDKRVEPLPIEAVHEGDPLKVGEAPWSQEVFETATSWYQGRGLLLGSVDLGKVLEYNMLLKLNALYSDEEADGETSIGDGGIAHATIALESAEQEITLSIPE